MKKAKFLAALTVFGAIGMTAVVSMSAFAADDPAGYVTFEAEKTVIGQGLVTEPVTVEFYEGENGIDVAKRAADVIVTESDYGDYITAFAEIETEGEVPAEIAAVCPEMNAQRIQEGYLSAMDYTAESGWSFYVNDEYSMVGISSYLPQDGDVISFKFTVYGYGADLGVDNSSWGGAAALITPAKSAALMELLAQSDDLSDSEEYAAALECISQYNPSQEDIDAAYAALLAASQPQQSADSPAEDGEEDSEPSSEKGSPDTGAEGIAAVIGISMLAGAALFVSKRR